MRFKQFVNEGWFSRKPKVEGPIRFVAPDGARDIVVMEVPGKGRTAFYRSTGQNSGRPNEWFPFDGVGMVRGHLWFDKEEYSSGNEKEGMFRYGNEQLADVAKELQAMNIAAGKPTDDPVAVNQFINTNTSMHHNEMLKVYYKPRSKAVTPPVHA